MKKDLFPGHATSVTVGELEVQDRRQGGRGEAGNVVQVPGIRGLYIASEIARAHGGTLTVHSIAGETRFTFRMPKSGPEMAR